MGRQAKFTSDQFLDAALALVANKGPAAATMAHVAKSLGAPIGSVYHRFDSRNLLLARLWLRAVDSFQAGFLDALRRGEGLKAALHTPRWVRAHPREARVLLLHRREELMGGDWPGQVTEHAAKLSRELDDGLREFTNRTFGVISHANLRRVTFALIDVPYAAVSRHLRKGETPPHVVDVFVQDTYVTIMGRDT